MWSPGNDAGRWIHVTAQAKTEQRLAIKLIIPKQTKPGRYVIPIDIRQGNRSLPQFVEALVDVATPGT